MRMYQLICDVHVCMYVHVCTCTYVCNYVCMMYTYILCIVSNAYFSSSGDEVTGNNIGSSSNPCDTSSSMLCPDSNVTMWMESRLQNICTCIYHMLY